MSMSLSPRLSKIIFYSDKHTYTHIHTCTFMHIDTYIHTHMHSDTHNHTHIYILTCTYMHKYTKMHRHICTHTLKHIHTQTHMNIHIYRYLHTDTYTQTQTHTCKHSQSHTHRYTYMHRDMHTHTHAHIHSHGQEEDTGDNSWQVVLILCHVNNISTGLLEWLLAMATGFLQNQVVIPYLSWPLPHFSSPCVKLGIVHSAVVISCMGQPHCPQKGTLRQWHQEEISSVAIFKDGSHTHCVSLVI